MEASPDVQMHEARVARFEGRMDEATYHATVDRLAPQLGTASPPPATSAEAASQLEKLREQRLQGMPEADYLAAVEKLGPLAHPATDSSAAMQTEIDSMMAPPETPFGYRLDTPEPLGEEARAEDLSIRESLLAVGVPARLGGVIVEAFNAQARRLGNASELEIEAHVRNVGEQLRERWGGEFDAKRERLETFIAEAAEKSEMLAGILDATPWALADVGLAEWLLSIAEHRAGRRA